MKDDPRLKNIIKAVEKFSKKHEPNTKSRKTKNNHPEKDLVKQLIHWLKSHGFDCNVVESKAVFNPKANRYISSQATPGFSDICGVDAHGRAVFIEAKAKGKLKTLSHKQYFFLLEKINRKAFAVCVDSVEKLEQIYSNFLKLDDNEKILYLKDLLPKVIKDESEGNLF